MYNKHIYSNHTVTVIGYEAWENKAGYKVCFLQVYDGYSESVRYIDFKRMPNIYSISVIYPK
jgi:hypothetical protein